MANKEKNVERILMITLYPVAKYFVFFLILIIGVSRMLFEIAVKR
jgi:hypothetical protein